MANIDSGPAFPTPDCSAWDGPSRTAGMTLRDWFAGQALTGLVTPGSTEPAEPLCSPPELHRYIAELAFALADAMIAARGK
jgi:hypothetical protein